MIFVVMETWTDEDSIMAWKTLWRRWEFSENILLTKQGRMNAFPEIQQEKQLQQQDSNLFCWSNKDIWDEESFHSSSRKSALIIFI